MTPFWVAERLLEEHFPALTEHDYGLEPTCGTGSFLRAIPAHVPAYGVELDQAMAARAARETGRTVLHGDVLTLDLRKPQPTFVLGNPPYRSAFVHALLERLHELLPPDAPVGLLLPSYFFQNDVGVARLTRRWGLETRMVPKTAFSTKMVQTLVWALFRRGRAGEMVGLALYDETRDARQMPAEYRRLLRDCAGSSWREVVVRAVVRLGGEAGLDEIYARVSPERPSRNPWWREKVRQQCQEHLEKVGPARYRVPMPPFELEAA